MNQNENDLYENITTNYLTMRTLLIISFLFISTNHYSQLNPNIIQHDGPIPFSFDKRDCKKYKLHEVCKSSNGKTECKSKHRTKSLFKMDKYFKRTSSQQSKIAYGSWDYILTERNEDTVTITGHKVINNIVYTTYKFSKK